MAHYPRGIASFNVDSQATLWSYMRALVQQEEAISTMRCAGEFTIVGDAMGPLCLQKDTLFKQQVFAYQSVLEFQGRGTKHIHVLAWGAS